MTTLWASTIVCHSVMAVRTVISLSNYMFVYVDNREAAIVYDTAISTGQGGFGVIGAPAGNVIAEADLGPLDRVGPQAVNAQSIATSSFDAEPSGSQIRFHVQIYTASPLGSPVLKAVNYWVAPFLRLPE